MKVLRQFGFLRLSFRQGQGSAEDGRVLTLFHKRATLKKAYNGLQDEVYRLKERIRQQENATQRVQEMLGALESQLGVVETAYPALVFYQLRALWQLGHDLIGQFVADLVSQREERERRAHFAEYNSRRFSRKQNVQNSLREAERQLADARVRLAHMEGERIQLMKFWHYLKRRRLDRRIEALRAKVASAEATLFESRAAAEALEAEPPPQFPGLSLEARRTINLAAIAYAETLCLRIVRTQLVTLAKEAAARRRFGNEYGSREQCETIMSEIAQARALLEVRSNIAQEVKVRADRLKQVARYRGSNDTTPTPQSIAFSEGDVVGGEALGPRATARMPNVLAEDTWDLFRVLLR